MGRNYYSEINLHLTWHTKESLPLLDPQVEPLAHRYVRQKIINTPGAFVHEIGGTETHVHVAVSVPPSAADERTSSANLKGASSHEVNEQLGLRGKMLQWQSRLRRGQLRHGRLGLGERLRPQPARAPCQWHEYTIGWNGLRS